jgi:hypothetical protein
MMQRPHTIGQRYPQRWRRKLVIVEEQMTPIERGVRITPLIMVERCCTEVA